MYASNASALLKISFSKYSLTTLLNVFSFVKAGSFQCFFYGVVAKFMKSRCSCTKSNVF